MTASTLDIDARDVQASSGVPRRSATTRRLWLVGGCIAATALALRLADPTAPSRFEPDLVTLLRGMAAIKTLLVAAAMALLAWRLGRPVTTRIATAYVTGASFVAGATAMIWQLSSIVPASAVFHAGLLTLLVAAWRDEAPLPPGLAIPRGR